MTLATIIIIVLELFLIVTLLYYYFLLLASIPNRQQKAAIAPSQTRFAILIPAHNEAAVIAKTVKSMLAMDYPREFNDVVVIADHCEDQTAEIARKAGAICYERKDGKRGRKGYALAWMLQRLIGQSEPYDAYLIFDADSRVNAELLQSMNSELVHGALALQGQHIISNIGESLYNRLAAIDMRLNNRLRNKAKDNLGLSCRLMGDAMCFAHQLFVQYPWKTFSLVEDMEYGVHILRQGVRVRYVPSARSYGQAAGDWRRAERQRLRWSGGILDVRRRLALQIFTDGLKKRDMALLDRAFELLLPTYSALVALSLLLLAVKVGMILLDQPVIYWDMLVISVAWTMLPLIGLALDRAPRSLFAAYIFSPIYLVWRIWIGLLTFLRRKRIDWVRTPRREEG